MRQRSLSARYEKARRGELVVSAPVGFVKAGDSYEKDGEKRFLDGVIDPQTAKGDATRLAIIHPAAAAAIARDVMLGARVPKRQLAPAAAAIIVLQVRIVGCSSLH